MCKISQEINRKLIFASIGLAMLSTLPAMADSVVVISLAGEAFEGQPSFDLLIDGKVVGSGTLSKAIETEADGRLFTKPRPSSFLEEFSFTVSDAVLKPNAELSLILTNDKFAKREGQGEDGIFDRNLFVDFVRVNDIEITSADMVLVHDGDVVHHNYQAGFLPIYEKGYSAIVRPPAGGWTAVPAGDTAKVSMADIPMPLPRPTKFLAAEQVQP
jgi:hypothetical protein